MIDRPRRVPPQPHGQSQAQPHAQPRVTDVSPKKLLAEIQVLLAERDATHRDLDNANRETQTALEQRDDLQRERDEYLAALQRERAEFQNFRRRTADERDAMLGLAGEGLIRKVLALA